MTSDSHLWWQNNPKVALPLIDSSYKKIPFYDILLPLAKQGVYTLREELKKNNFESNTYVASAFYYLLLKLSKVTSLTFYSELNYFKMIFENKKISYKDFVRDLSTKNTLFQEEYPVLKETIQHNIEQWLLFSVELALKLKKDVEHINNFFQAGGITLRHLTKVEFEKSDRHKKGKTVCFLHFGKFTVVYKPKALHNDLLYNDILTFMNTRLDDHDFYLPKILNCSDYGWTTFVPHGLIRTHSETKLYYHRIGRVLGVLYLTNSTDNHFENLICFNNTPVVVDHESLCTPPFNKKYVITPLLSGNGYEDNSVLRTGILPRLNFIDGGTGYIENAAIKNHPNASNTQRWINTNKINMRIGTAKLKKSRATNLPNAWHPHRFSKEIITGFKQCLEFAQLHKKEFSEILNNGAKNITCRILLRPSEFYGSLIKKSYTANSQRSKENLMGLKTVLKNSFQQVYSPLFFEHGLSLIIDREYEDLTIGTNIPLFSCSGTSTQLYLNDQVVSSKLITQSPLEATLKTIKNLSDDDIRNQTEIIEKSLRIKKNSLLS